ncbi:molybdopterin converting factor subunit 1 [Candidatus Bathyarchaeota archaeon]|nr:molybdopterin converting factor subunit 1 [Candidatus Bathyarchaeota archaeon]
MRVDVRYFASFRDATGKTEEALEVPEGINVQGIREHVKGLYERIAKREQVLVAVNGAFMPLETVIREGDVVAFFPPVSGG